MSATPARWPKWVPSTTPDWPRWVMSANPEDLAERYAPDVRFDVCKVCGKEAVVGVEDGLCAHCLRDESDT